MRKPDEDNPCEERGCDGCIRFREAWTPGSIYRPGDAVPNNGSSYVAIHWNQNDPPPSPNWATIASKGDAGPAGAQGAQGAPGPAGPSGSSDVYASGLHQVPDANPQGVDVASLAIPAGAYVVMSTIAILNRDPDDQTWTIELHDGGNVISTIVGRTRGAGGGGIAIVGDAVPDSGTLLATYSPPTGTTLTLRAYGYNMNCTPNVFLAMKVGAIHAT